MPMIQTLEYLGRAKRSLVHLVALCPGLSSLLRPATVYSLQRAAIKNAHFT